MSSARLHRTYRLLLLAYPGWYRRERGAEIITTLLDDAEAGQRKARPADVLDIVLGGLRSRLRPPRRFGSYLVAAVTAVYVGVAGAAVGVLASGFPGPPSDAAAVAAATAAVPGNPRNVAGPELLNCDLFCPFGYNPFLDGPSAPADDDVVASRATPERTDGTAVYFAMPWSEAYPAVDAAWERLLADGWQVTPMVRQSDGPRWFEASKDGLHVTVSARGDDPLSENPGRPVIVVVTKLPSTAAVAALVTGLLAGLLVGWTTAVGVLQRLRRQRLLLQVVTRLAALPFQVIAPPMLFLVLMMAMIGAGDSSPKAVKAPLVVLVPGAWWPITTLAIVSAAVTVLLTALPGHGRLWRRTAPAALRQP